MVINVLDAVSAADTGAQGAIIRDLIRSELSVGRTIELSFDGIISATPSFVNVCFVDLLQDFSLMQIKAGVKVIKSTTQINSLIKDRLEQTDAARDA